MQQVYVAAALSALALFVRAELPARVASTAALPRSTPNATASSTASPMAGEAVSSTVPVQLQHHRTTAGLIVGAVTAPPHHRRSTTAPPHHRRSTTAAPPHHRQSQLHQLHHLKWQLHQLLLRQSQLHHRRSTTAAPPPAWCRRGAGGGAKKHKHRRMIAGRFVVHICGAVVSLVFVTLSGVALYRRRRTKKFCSVQVVRNIDLGHSASEIVRRDGVPDGRRAGQHRGAGAAAAPPPAPPPPVAVAPVAPPPTVAPPPYDRRPDCRLSTVRNAVTLKDKTRRLFFPIVDDRESLITDQREDV